MSLTPAGHTRNTVSHPSISRKITLVWGIQINSRTQGRTHPLLMLIFGPNTCVLHTGVNGTILAASAEGVATQHNVHLVASHQTHPKRRTETQAALPLPSHTCNAVTQSCTYCYSQKGFEARGDLAQDLTAGKPRLHRLGELTFGDRDAENLQKRTARPPR